MVRVARALLGFLAGLFVLSPAFAQGPAAAAAPAPAPAAAAVQASANPLPAPATAAPAGSAAKAQDCSATPDYEGFRKSFIAAHGPVLAAPATMILATGWSARLLMHEALPVGASEPSFRVFEVDRPGRSESAAAERTVLAVEPAADSGDGRFKATDSVSLRVNVPSGEPWVYRTFVVVACRADQPDAWAEVSAPVSNPVVTWAICIGVGLLAYGLSMAAIFVQRRQKSPLAEKYPAVFGARDLNAADILNPIHLIANAFNQGSVQKAQVLLFSFLVAELVLAMVLNTGALVDLSPTVVGLLGISGVGAATAQVAYTQKTRLSFENWAWLEKKNVFDRPGALAGPFWRDLVLSNREFDVYKLQTIIFTVAVAAALIVGGASHLSTFSVPQTLLGVLGLSQVVYVGGILAKPGTVADLDDSITKLRAADALVAAAQAQKTDIDDKQKLILPPPAGLPPADAAKNALQYRSDLAETVAAMIESTLEIDVKPGTI
jgi:hypothetical protein